MSYEEMLAISDPEAPSEESTEKGTPAPEPSQGHSTVCTTPTVHNINVNYIHTYSVLKKDDNEVDIPSLLQSLANHSSIESSSALVKSSSPTKALLDSNKTATASAQPKKRKLVLENRSKPLIFTAFDLSDPPSLKYTSDLDQLVHDWDNSDYFIIKQVPIPLKYWSKVYCWARPETWEAIKDNWSNWKVLSHFMVGIRNLRGRQISKSISTSQWIWTSIFKLYLTLSFLLPLSSHILT
jgi:hypothetical protein